ncbi:Heat-shock related protein Hsr1 [Candida maltosa Xu316]|uniref:Heat-shock related protein Hsr1 n=1 Tax=Candida maltosa (strain Xu316) TaxID=1245528 RepID=M3JZR8_CANMX|nr:Heat-shock related protein Hsr1 [Candida maltosa Xu316]
MSKKTNNNGDPRIKKNAFVHKLYTMLNDPNLSHLIWWTNNHTEENTFALYPGKEFANCLTQYFKHGNVASFVRQLHMYGFHKVTEPSTMNNGQSMAPSSSSSTLPHNIHNNTYLNQVTKDVPPIWEFKHSSGKFKKGDEKSLAFIKRRSSSNNNNHNNSLRIHHQHNNNNNNNNNHSNSVVYNDGIHQQYQEYSMMQPQQQPPPPTSSLLPGGTPSSTTGSYDIYNPQQNNQQFMYYDQPPHPLPPPLPPPIQGQQPQPQLIYQQKPPAHLVYGQTYYPYPSNHQFTEPPPPPTTVAPPPPVPPQQYLQPVPPPSLAADSIQQPIPQHIDTATTISQSSSQQNTPNVSADGFKSPQMVQPPALTPLANSSLQFRKIWDDNSPSSFSSRHRNPSVLFDPLTHVPSQPQTVSPNNESKIERQNSINLPPPSSLNRSTSLNIVTTLNNPSKITPTSNTLTTTTTTTANNNNLRRSTTPLLPSITTNNSAKPTTINIPRNSSPLVLSSLPGSPAPTLPPTTTGKKPSLFSSSLQERLRPSVFELHNSSNSRKGSINNQSHGSVTSSHSSSIFSTKSSSLSSTASINSTANSYRIPSLSTNNSGRNSIGVGPFDVLENNNNNGALKTWTPTNGNIITGSANVRTISPIGRSFNDSPNTSNNLSAKKVSVTSLLDNKNKVKEEGEVVVSKDID